MTEKDKMILGKPYMASDKELQKDRLEAQRACYRYNQIDPKNYKERKALIRGLFGETDALFCIEQPFYCDYGFNIRIGNNFFSNYHLTILDCAPVTIGENVMFGPNVSIYTAGHPIHPEIRNTGLEFALPVTIGDNVWIGGNVVINPNVNIGANSVIGSGSVVTKDIPANVIAVGNPCKVIRKITDEDKKYYYKNREI
ncbi:MULTISPECIES: sugar O-acetyltransferase [Sphingobacterium]|uniref:Acetyltransferase n=1 Tax=Sphingobacterium litopenaei TaxID=2763500 RepID=A0ABR7YDF0_9SPHI|nr:MULTISPECIES: sugar O-acetyltransferase [Sphingobacterium]MBD1429344.1 sugar O-acetyltransferase [Sphingobacterium litopenaei]NGM71943.1 sugar O-acetyltransferase [Sphingobacterium sp. SGL-16]